MLKKSSFVRFGKRYKEHGMDINIDGVPLNVCCDVKYLGVSFVAGTKLKVSLSQKRLKFFRAFNSLYASIGANASHVVMTHLLQTFCIPIVLYGLESVCLTKSNLCSLQYMLDMSLFKIVKTEDKTTVDYCLYYLNILPVSYALDLRKLKFLRKQSASANSVVHVLYDINSSKEYEALCAKYRVHNRSNLCSC